MDRFLRIVYNDNDLPIGNQWRHFFDGIEVIKTDKQIQNQRRWSLSSMAIRLWSSTFSRCCTNLLSADEIRWFDLVHDFFIGTMVQRETIRNRKLAVRFLAGAWCLTCFVLVTAYSSVLISFVTSPNYKPLVNSIYDLPKDTRIKMTVNKGLYPDVANTLT